MKIDIRRRVFKDINEALLFMADCTLATVAHQAMLKSKKRSEFERQINIAQAAVDFIKHSNIECSKTRAHEIITLFDGNVVKWAEQYYPK